MAVSLPWEMEGPRSGGLHLSPGTLLQGPLPARLHSGGKSLSALRMDVSGDNMIDSSLFVLHLQMFWKKPYRKRIDSKDSLVIISSRA